MPRRLATPVDGQIGGRVRLRRLSIGMSQAKLGESLGLTFQQIQKYENGLNKIGAGRLHQISQVLGVPVTTFFPDSAGPISDHRGTGAFNAIAHPSADGLRLTTYFVQIRDLTVRNRVFELIKCLADDGDQAAGAGEEAETHLPD